MSEDVHASYSCVRHNTIKMDKLQATALPVVDEFPELEAGTLKSR